MTGAATHSGRRRRRRRPRAHESFLQSGQQRIKSFHLIGVLAQRFEVFEVRERHRRFFRLYCGEGTFQ